MNTWRKTKSRYLVKSKWLTLRSDSCQTQQGETIDPYYVLEFPDWVNIVAFDFEKRILLTKQYRHAVGETCTEIPCGEIEPDESPLEAAKRELEEETGYTSAQFTEIGCLYPNPARQNNKVYCFMATDCAHGGDTHPDPSEIVECHFVDIPMLMNLIESGRFSQALHISSVLLALRKTSLVK